MADKMTVEFVDLPVWAKDALKELGFRRQVTVEIGTSHSFPGSMSDNSLRTFVTHVEPEGKIVVRRGSYGGQAPWKTREQNQISSPGTINNFPPHIQVLRHETGWKCPTATLYVHPNYMAKALPKIVDPADIPWVIKVVLFATRSLKSSYGGVKDLRKVEAMRDTGITAEEFDQGRELAIEKGYLRKNKAITASGRNAITDIGIYSLFDLRRADVQ